MRQIFCLGDEIKIAGRRYYILGLPEHIIFVNCEDKGHWNGLHPVVGELSIEFIDRCVKKENPEQDWEILPDEPVCTCIHKMSLPEHCASTEIKDCPVHGEKRNPNLLPHGKPCMTLQVVN